MTEPGDTQAIRAIIDFWFLPLDDPAHGKPRPIWWESTAEFDGECRSRFDNLAKLLVEYSTRLKRNETVLVEAFDVPDEMTIALVRAVRAAGALPFVQLQHGRVSRELALSAPERQLNLSAIHELARMKRMNAYIALRGSNNVTEMSDVPPDQMKL